MTARPQGDSRVHFPARNERKADGPDVHLRSRVGVGLSSNQSLSLLMVISIAPLGDRNIQKSTCISTPKQYFFLLYSRSNTGPKYSGGTTARNKPRCPPLPAVVRLDQAQVRPAINLGVQVQPYVLSEQPAHCPRTCSRHAAVHCSVGLSTHARNRTCGVAVRHHMPSDGSPGFPPPLAHRTGYVRLDMSRRAAPARSPPYVRDIHASSSDGPACLPSAPLVLLLSLVSAGARTCVRPCWTGVATRLTCCQSTHDMI